MNIDLVFTNEEQMTRLLFSHITYELMKTFSSMKDPHKCCSLWYVGVKYAECESSESYELLDCAYISSYIRKHPGIPEYTQQKRIMTIYAVKDLKLNDGTCHISVEIPDNNIAIKLTIDKLYSERIDKSTPRVLIEFCSIDKDKEKDLTAAEYYKDLFSNIVGPIISDAAFFDYDSDDNITGYTN